MSDGDQPDDAQKTEEPTSKKLEDARKKGQVPLSREVNNWLMILAGTVLIAAVSNTLFSNLRDLMREFIEKSYAFPSGVNGLTILLSSTAWEVFLMMALILLALVLAAFIGPFGQIGPLFTTEKIKPDISKVSPIKGFSRLFSMNSLMEFAKGVLKLALIAIVGVIIVRPYFNSLDHLMGVSFQGFLDELKTMVLQMLIGVLVVLFIIAVVDLVYQRYQHYKQMRMTKQEVKDEYKQSEGDPHVKARLRQLRSEKARKRMMQNVPKADVVITNPTHYSIALQYDPETMEAPVCLAKGVDEIALKIREVAKEHDILIYEAPPLARALYGLVEIDETIPPEQYKAVAEVISYVFKMRKNKL
ncbi:MAG: flagellar biosynthesis protein FlhB [Alphaproteobacteria bacterium]|nr:flagellar biosynthesis protein FlhB [Alphaproteobacteria bacterium]MCD8526574.1 flagellar biosynthesis protein FlhB [Alphaproteobacteria bacterium]MCD8570312.1 flagellar biosynthesis protein FlhB [Alphaproteobacteria bacterium]